MITTRGEYDFVNIPYSILVNGDVIPLRKGHGQSILRGEDIAFLLEAVERKHCMIGDTTINRTLDRTIVGGNYRYVIS